MAWVCDACRGVWLPLQYLHAIRYAHNFPSYEDFGKALAASPTTITSFRCPLKCAALVHVNWLEEPFCWCQSCQGIWFEHDALRALLKRLERNEPELNIGAYATADFSTQALMVLLGSLSC